MIVPTYSKVNGSYNHIEASGGVALKRLPGLGDGREYFVWEYSHDLRRLRFETFHSHTGIDIDLTTIAQWEPPHDAERLTEDKRQEVIRRIDEAFTAIGESHQFHTPDHVIPIRVDDRTVRAERHFELLRLSDAVYVLRQGERSMVVKARLVADPHGGPAVPWIRNADLRHWCPPHERVRVPEADVPILHFYLQRGLAQFGHKSVVFELENGRPIWMS